MVLIGCGKKKEVKKYCTQTQESKYIFNGIDWVDANKNHNKYLIAQTIGLLFNVKQNKRCSSFLINKNTIITNHHCVSNDEDAENVIVSFNYERDTDDDDITFYQCDKFIGGDENLDLAILECSGDPGDKYGYVELDDSNVFKGDPIYVVHQNCHKEEDPSCSPDKKISPGTISRIRYSSKDDIHNVFFDADILPGSSGSAVFSKESNKVIALTNKQYHYVKNDEVIPVYNGGVAMSDIIPFIQNNYPNVLLKSYPKCK